MSIATHVVRWNKVGEWTSSFGPIYSTANVTIHGAWKRDSTGPGQGRKVKCYKVFIRRKDGSLCKVGLGSKAKLAEAKSLAIKAVNTQGYIIEHSPQHSPQPWVVRDPNGGIFQTCREYIHASNLAPGAVLKPSEVDPDDEQNVAITVSKNQARVILSALSRRHDELDSLGGQQAVELRDEAKAVYQSIASQAFGS